MTYKAIVAKIYIRELPGADKLVIGSCGSYQVIVGKETVDGQLGLFFEQDGQLSEEFAENNDLVRRKNPDGTQAGGMFEPNRRVKAIKLRGAKSEGFWCPLDRLSYAGDISSLKEGDQLDEFNDHKICGKYFTPATQHQRRSSKPQKDNRMFHKHVDTGMFRRESHLIPDGATCYISEKLHGTSMRYGHVLDEEPIQRHWIISAVAKWVGFPSTRKTWKHLVGTRNVILEHKQGETFYGDESFRYECVKGLSLHKGEVIYGEIVGYSHGDTPIMATQSTTTLKDKSIKSQFGDTVTYSYGCLPGQHKMYLYRITQVNEDGVSIELSWKQVVKRAKELGLETVPHLKTWHYHNAHDQDALASCVAYLTEAENGSPLPSTVDPSVIREGVVVRYESEHGTGWLKNKSFTFGVLEGYLKESDSYVDAEEAA
jgi:hypothetical protein